MLQQIKHLYKAYKHYTKVCKDNNIQIIYKLRPNFPYYSYAGEGEKKKIYVPLPTSLENITIIYHEIGHLVHRKGTTGSIYGKTPNRQLMLLIELFGDKFTLTYECNAHLWAMRNSPIKLSYKILDRSLLSYEKSRETYKPKKLLNKVRTQMHQRCKL